MPSLKQRTLKIEAIGDYARGKIKPRIRLTGCWLDRAGFKPGQRVEVHVHKPGEMTLQLKEEAPVAESNEPS
jgi:hypothetical protein